ncbi:MAG: Zn-dependent oligopeptidase [Verrucomicrobiae bacterium]|nr:Zn-dependent oligopeptidase [Verrucomicrobiae bacterium]
MFKRLLLMLMTATMLTSCARRDAPPAFTDVPPASTGLTLAEFQRRAQRFGNVIVLPQFETTPEAIQTSLSNTIATANAALDRIGALAPAEVTFENTVLALDDALYEAGLLANRLSLIKETSTQAALRDAATDAIKKFQEWAVGLDYREDVYRAVKAFADKQPRLDGEAAKLLEETLRDYRRAGLHLPKAERDEVERLRKELARLGTDFDTNITKAKKALKFTRAELEGLPEDFLNLPEIKTGPDEFTILANVTWQYLMVMENARREDVRRRMLIAQHTLAKEENLPLLEKILGLRATIARKLGYASWADYQIEVRMAKTARTAMEFEERLARGLEPKFTAEREQFRQMKVAETGDPNAKVELWDWRYYANRLKKERYNVDAEQLRVFFPMQRVLDGMFAIYQRIFGLKFERVEPPYKWIDDLQLWAVSDAATGEPLGLFYLDLFPREGKYHHFAEFGLIDGKRLRNGLYQRPVCALVCNFPPPSAERPSLLKHSDVETIFHEFGHAMHVILTRATYGRFAGTAVPRDFVEAPSQMLEAWVWDKKVLDSFAADYRDPSRKIPQDILAQLKAARLAVEATRYRRQLAFGMMDLMLHTQITEANASETLPLANRILSEVFYPMPEGTALPAYFGHLVGYDAGYYGYAWADAIAADMETVFEQSPEGFFDATVGRRLRDEIYAVGDSRDVNVSIERFLGRPWSIEPFLKKIGVN